MYVTELRKRYDDVRQTVVRKAMDLDGRVDGIKASGVRVMVRIRF